MLFDNSDVSSHPTMIRQLGWINKNLVGTTDPRLRGKGLIANRSGQWQYRIGDYRLICLIEDDKLVIIALSIGHRRDI